MASIIPTFNAVVVPPAVIVPTAAAVAASIPSEVAAPVAAAPAIPPIAVVPAAIAAQLLLWMQELFLLPLLRFLLQLLILVIRKTYKLLLHYA